MDVKWTLTEEIDLLNEVELKINLQDIAVLHKRADLEIKNRLILIGEDFLNQGVSFEETSEMLNLFHYNIVLDTHREPYIYILELSHGKYYVGTTTEPQNRILAHFSNNGSAWTRKYKPKSVLKCVQGDLFDEDKITKQYMNDYGIDNVRGGSYCQLCLDRNQLKSIKKELMTINGQCFNCGERGHFLNNCYNRIKMCQRCGRTSHVEKECYARIDVDGNFL